LPVRSVPIVEMTNSMPSRDFNRDLSSRDRCAIFRLCSLVDDRVSSIYCSDIHPPRGVNRFEMDVFSRTVSHHANEYDLSEELFESSP